jgi:hypothetical protein
LFSAPLLLLIVLQTASPSVEFARGKVAFGRGEYARTIEIVRPLLYPEPRLDSEGEIAQAHRMLGVAHLFERQSEQAAQEFRKLLQLRPDYRMDPFLDPPLVVDFFNGVLKQQEGELAELERRRQEARAEEQRRLDAARTGPTYIEKRYLRNSFAVSFIPFGAGQFQNGHRGKGWFFLASESLLAATSIGAMTTNFALYGFRPALDCVPTTQPGPGQQGCGPGLAPTPDRARSRLILKAQLVSGALFFATAIWGVTDAVLNYQPEVPLEGPPKATTGDTLKGPATVPSAERKPAAGLSDLQLGPLLFGSDAIGGGLAFRF